MELAQKYENAKVTIHYEEGTFTDTGRLLYLDSYWVEIRKDNGDRILAPTSNIRIIKIIEVPESQADRTTLLRAPTAAIEPGTGAE